MRSDPYLSAALAEAEWSEAEGQVYAGSLVDDPLPLPRAIPAREVRPGDVGPWGSMALEVTPRGRYGRTVIRWTGGAGPGLRGKHPDDVRVEVYDPARPLTITRREA